MKKKIDISYILILSSILLLINIGYSSGERDYIIKAGVMEPSSALKDRLRETREITMDPMRRPGWCFIVDPHSIHYLPKPPRRLTGDFKDEDPTSVKKGIMTRPELVNGIRPFCFDFHQGDPLGDYKVEVMINGMLKTTLSHKVVAPEVQGTK
jgi:hypothetical protein